MNHIESYKKGIIFSPAKFKSKLNRHNKQGTT